MALTGQQFPIVAGEHEATIVEVGAGLRRYTHRGTDVTVPYGEDFLTPKCCGTALVPWPNRLRGGRYEFEGRPQQLAITEPALGNASHGLGRWTRWAVAGREPHRVTLALDIVPQAGYPFEVRVEVDYALDAETGLGVTCTATNHGTGRAPFGAGFHPYLSTHGAPLDEVEVTVPAASHLQLDDAQIPVGSQPVEGSVYDLREPTALGPLRLDDGFTALTHEQGRGRARVASPRGGATLWFDENIQFLQVFTLDDLAGAGPGVAVEPMSCAADAYNSGDGLVTLEPGTSWTARWGIVPD